MVRPRTCSGNDRSRHDTVNDRVGLGFMDGTVARASIVCFSVTAGEVTN